MMAWIVDGEAQLAVDEARLSGDGTRIVDGEAQLAVDGAWIVDGEARLSVDKAKPKKVSVD